MVLNFSFIWYNMDYIKTYYITIYTVKNTGTYNSNTQGGFRWDACTPCPQGSACYQLGQTSGTTHACSTGSYCIEGTEFPDQNPCIAGTYTDSTSLINPSGCTACTAGYYCKIGTTSGRRVLCPRGYYCLASTGYSHAYPCPAGYYLWSLGNSVATACIACPSGMYC